MQVMQVCENSALVPQPVSGYKKLPQHCVRVHRWESVALSMRSLPSQSCREGREEAFWLGGEKYKSLFRTSAAIA